MSEKPQSERYCKTCGDRHLPPTGSKCPRVSSISPTKLAARFMNLDVDRGAGFTDHEGAVGNDSAEQWDTAFPTKPNKPSADPGTNPSHLQTMVRSHQNQLATLQNMMGSLVSTVDKMAARLHKTARKSGDTSSDSSSSGYTGNHSVQKWLWMKTLIYIYIWCTVAFHIICCTFIFEIENNKFKIIRGSFVQAYTNLLPG